MTNLVNLTPHRVVICAEDGSTLRIIEPSGEVARVRHVSIEDEPIDGIPTERRTLSADADIPSPRLGTAFIVSGLVAAVAGRRDVLSPGDLVRDDRGQVTGCRTLIRSA